MSNFTFIHIATLVLTRSPTSLADLITLLKLLIFTTSSICLEFQDPYHHTKIFFWFFHLNANSDNDFAEDPSLFSAFPAASCKLFIFPRTFSPSSPFMSSFTTLAISSLSTIPTSFALGLSATFKPSFDITAFIFCSAYSGQAIRATP
ncbi:hypothetical protein RHGRI_019302 [Rhododendron griersonianum]|uniref:Uncharacterized protein n=1 Tax=Rhododendron griersonianum TaxID=479676 RepID=A0AAV6JC43_9ERIC|nr:hypothetical protein RHGRI_019302 [Rhododendron griersonianum]